ncbi:uncharacterized protein LOC120255388 [Dioscorea cayenensis subsp. rotundata]|uniref:Uncharacterized protein LOC120255388 n=1 Tax=Dioscorea cayennensis subsp. rotundata TaxID=55577 RepID=A0AB40AWD5_DIOCR|nr:uncharacterized protein LOC120255388 [Dioscorea cayenensis subsp. rotundata]
MASRVPPAGHSLQPPSRSWAQITSQATCTIAGSPLHNLEILGRIKASSSQFVRVDDEALGRARMKFQNSLYGKFFGKPPSFDEVKLILMAKWVDIGEVCISDLPNGFLLIRYGSHSVMQKLLHDGPWSINGIILQLSPWKPFFEPAFAKLNKAAIWVQLHNLPLEFWDGETLESLTTHLGPLLKVDELIISLSRSKFARLCIEIDISKSLCRGFWVGDSDHRVFVLVLYERLPTFCYSCGMIGHGYSSCPGVTVVGTGGNQPPLRSQRRPEVGSSSGTDIAARTMDLDDIGHDPPKSCIAVDPLSFSLESDFGP